ncbi:MAG TPA: 2-octaprenyl-6-methoxyphenyl hydroxylase [Gammaproteobacteria bacterium]|nr:2-octaprenyl-6-methoxyphenyl hydroxylase [Gammaproteobacteria bacterium]
MNKFDYDLVISGGGLAGCSLACALANTGVRIALLEQMPFRQAQQAGYDERSIALAYGSRRIFESMGLWRDMSPSAAAIKNIHISDRGHFGAARLAATDGGHEALGYVVEISKLSQVLATRVQQQDNLDLFMPAALDEFSSEDDCVRIVLDHDGERREISAALLVAADGMQSTIREKLNIVVREWNYGQTALIANVTTSNPHQNVAYERFTNSGPLALLPMTDSADTAAGCRRALVWTIQDEQLDEAMAWSEQEFLSHLQQRFGFRAGCFEHVGQRQSFPLRLMMAERSIDQRVALIGNAAHTLHPVAGQGFNLGIRDVAVLAELIADSGSDPGSDDVLESYARQRQHDHRNMVSFTDTVARVFSNPLPPVMLARGLGLLALDNVPGMKSFLTRRTMGLAGRLPRLARGLPL